MVEFRGKKKPPRSRGKRPRRVVGCKLGWQFKLTARSDKRASGLGLVTGPTAIPVVLRIFEPIALAFPPEGAQMPRLDATAAMPAGLLCRGFSHLPPAKVGWMGADSEDRRLFLICSDCGWNASDEALEQRVLAQLTCSRPATTDAAAAPASVAAATRAQTFPPPMAAAHEVQATPAAPWVQAAAREWARQGAPPAA